MSHHRIALAIGMALSIAAAQSAAQPPSPNVRPWIPPQADSITVWAARARAGFRANQGDSVGGGNFPAYQQVGRIGREMLRLLGHANVRQAYAIEPALNALGLPVELRIDPAQPGFVLLMVRNPYRLTAGSVGFLYWWRGEELKFQGAYFRGGREARFRVWWTGRADSPYLCGVIDHLANPGRTLEFLLLRMNYDASYWDLLQYPGAGPAIDASGEADWEDLNGDGVPELVAWLRAPSDSTFSECTGCPGLFIERVYTLHRDGYELEDRRLVPTPYAAFQLFIRLLGERNRAAAIRLLARPTLLDSALAEGWGGDRGAGAWRLDRVESGEQWPHWLSLRHQARPDHPVYAVHFNLQDGRWVISHWYRERYLGPDSTMRALYGGNPDSTRARTNPAQRLGGRARTPATAPAGPRPKGAKP